MYIAIPASGTNNINTRPQQHHQHIHLNFYSHLGTHNKQAIYTQENKTRMPRTDEAEHWFNAVYAAVQEIPPGKVTSYGHIALLLGERM